MEHWGAETGANPAVYLRNNGITRNTIKPGDKLELTCHPHRDPNAKVCLVMQAVVNGKVVNGIGFNVPPPKPVVSSIPAPAH